MDYELQNEDYLELWKFFQDKAISVKGAMFNTTTWVLGFAAALIGFIFANLAKFESSKATVPLPALIVVVSTAGLAICLYSFFALSESAKHIKNNWKYADRCKNKIKGLEEIYATGEDEKPKVIKIWNQLRIVVGLFAMGFICTLIYALSLTQ